MIINEQQIEARLLTKLCDLKYIHRPDIRDRATLEANFREKFEHLNRVRLTDSEFARLLGEITSPDTFKAAETLRTINSFERDDGTPLNYTLVNIKDWCKNHFEVINQLRINTQNSHHRYDVMLLINGVPVVQIELKALKVTPRKAMEQIVKYKQDAGNGYEKTLLCFMQLFIVSNETETWYFANNNARHFAFNTDERFLPVYQFADIDNKKITHLDTFAEGFLAKCTLGHMISRYMVLVASEQKLMMMRPYQIYAVRAMVACIEKNAGNGYIWHTTGSGKTLTSFKASTLLKDNPNIYKCLFVVDRKDLDRQTREEFNRFQEGCVEQNTNTEALVQRLLSDNHADKVIVTTIQKLGLALDGNSKKTYKTRLKRLQDKRMVFIFDECHRSQFGDNHKAIKEFFPKAQMFGFTGTPIFETNASDYQVADQKATFRTTEELFQCCLHEYTITHAIDDGNVLKFHVDYFKQEGGQNIASDHLTKRAIIEAILNKHATATRDRTFNALLATASINNAIEYYQLFKDIQAQKQAEDDTFTPLNIACVFSPPAEGNKDARQAQEDLPQEKADNKYEPDKKKAALTTIMKDYNQQFGTNHRIAEFDLYYQDVQKRIKDQQWPNTDLAKTKKIDITIVVDMLLTGFDSKYLNTLYVDKNLKYHGLIQAFSRTNRVLNDTKPYGTVVDFRAQQYAVDEAIKLFSGEKAEGAHKIWLAEPAEAVIERLQTATEKLSTFMHTQGLANKPEEIANLKGDLARTEFVSLFKQVQSTQNELDRYTDLEEAQKEQIAALLPPEQAQGFKSQYLETARTLRDMQDQPRADTPTEVQKAVDNTDFELVLFATSFIDYDYIMKLAAEMTGPVKTTKMTPEDLINLMRSDAKFMDEGEELAEYIRTLQMEKNLDEKAIHEGYVRFKAEKYAKQITDIAECHKLPAVDLQNFVDDILRLYIFDGERLTDLMAPLDLGWKQRSKKELELMAKLAPILRKRAKGRDISGLSVYEE